jgi:fumarylacetoacetase
MHSVIDIKSWVESANQAQTDFPIQNLPYGVFEAGGYTSIGAAIGDFILDLRACAQVGLLDGLTPAATEACTAESLNPLLALGPDEWSSLRAHVAELLKAGSTGRGQVEPLLVAQEGAVMRLPVTIGDYTDFFTSIYHATNVGNLFRPGNPLGTNYKYLPVGYHGRASSVVVSGTPVRRPSGQISSVDAPQFGPSRALDYELEVAAVVGVGNHLGEPVPIAKAHSHIFGLCLLNDWSARDIQMWESQPLGPFLAKSFATTLSPWVVPLPALEPFRVPAFVRSAGDPPPLPYLYSAEDQARGGIDLTVEAWLASRRMRESAIEPMRISRGNFRDTYWTIAQMLTHHTSNGCNLRPGDLFASGTLSGPTPESLACLLERTRRGAEPFQLPSGEERTYLEDGDEVILRGYCEREGCPRIGFGECRGIVTAAT